MNKLICPFCRRKLKTFAKYKDGTSTVYCSKCNLIGDSKLFSELIRTKELLDIERSEHEMCHTQMLKTTEKLERTRKALDAALCSLQDIAESNGDFITGSSTTLDTQEYAEMMLNKIKFALKQKD